MGSWKRSNSNRKHGARKADQIKGQGDWKAERGSQILQRTKGTTNQNWKEACKTVHIGTYR